MPLRLPLDRYLEVPRCRFKPSFLEPRFIPGQLRRQLQQELSFEVVGWDSIENILRVELREFPAASLVPHRRRRRRQRQRRQRQRRRHRHRRGGREARGEGKFGQKFRPKARIGSVASPAWPGQSRRPPVWLASSELWRSGPLIGSKTAEPLKKLLLIIVRGRVPVWFGSSTPALYNYVIGYVSNFPGSGRSGVFGTGLLMPSMLSFIAGNAFLI